MTMINENHQWEWKEKKTIERREKLKLLLDLR